MVIRFSAVSSGPEADLLLFVSSVRTFWVKFWWRVRAERRTCGRSAEGEENTDLQVGSKRLQESQCLLLSLRQDAEGPDGGEQLVLQRQVVMAMVRILRPPTSDAVRRPDGGGAHRLQGEGGRILELDSQKDS